MTAWHDDSNARARACELAAELLTDEEIASTLLVERQVSSQLPLGSLEDAQAFVAGIAPELETYRFYGGGKLRSKLYKVADGDKVLAKEMTRTSIAALELLGRQHLGYTSMGFDEEHRKLMEKAKRQRAKSDKGRGLRAV